MRIVDYFSNTYQNVKDRFKPKTESIIYPDQFLTAMAAFETVMGNMGFNGAKSADALGSAMSRYQVVHKNGRELRAQSRKSWLESTETRALVGRSVELTVSTGLKVEWTPVWEICDPNRKEEDQKKLVKEVEQKWRLFAESTESDITGRMSFYQIQRHLRKLRKVEGEYFAIVRYKDTEVDRMSPIALQPVRPEQIKNPTKLEDIDKIKARNNICVDGIEMDLFGKAVAYYVHDDIAGTYVRIEKYDKKSNRIFMLHGANIEEIGQIRGISSIASYLHELSKITGYKLAELQAALVNALIAVWIEPSAEANASKALSGLVKKTQVKESQTENPPARAQSETSGIIVQTLKAGEKLNSYNTQRPNVNFGMFYQTMMSTMSASEGYAESVMSIKFNSNYSAHRGELLLTWNKVDIEREEENTSLNNPIFTQWVQEMVRSGNLTLNGFNTSPYIRNAWTKADWIGIPKLDIDPTKTVQAAAARIKEGFSTRDRESQQINGSEFLDNVKKLEDENELLYKANKYLIQDSSRGNPIDPKNPNGMGGSPSNSDNKEVNDETNTED